MPQISNQLRVRQRNYTSLRAAFRSENGAIDLASIMVGIIVIGLIGGVIAATVFAVIPWAQDNAAKQQLDSIHTAENASYGLSADPTVTPDQSKRNMFTDSQGLADGKLLSVSTTYCVIPTAAGKDYAAYAKSASGKIWTASNSAKKAIVLSGTPAGACSVLGASAGGTATTSPVVTNGGVVTTYSAANWSDTQELDITADQTIYTTNVNTIKKMTAAGAITTIAGNGTYGFADGQGSAAQFNSPTGITLGPDGNLYVADYSNNRIRMVTPTGAVTTVLGNGTASSTNGDKSTATIAKPYDLTFDAAGNMYVAEAFTGQIRKMTPAGVVTTLATLPNGVIALEVDMAGNVYASSNTADTIMKITSAGVVSTFATSTAGRYGGLAVEQSTGIVYAVQRGDHTIEKILPDGTKTVLAGAAGQAGVINGTGNNARFANPFAITINSTGALIVSSIGTADTTLRMIK